MLLTASLSVISLLLGLALLISGEVAAVAALHGVFAVGILPLIFAAMIHFVPVLTRTGDPARGIRLLPAVAQASAPLAPLAMAGFVPYGMLHGVAMLHLGQATILLIWFWRRARAALGPTHPGWRWYAAALCCLMLALLAVLGMALWPAAWVSLRRLHLHLNTLGFVGFAAFGTLPLLLPTALGQPDPQAAVWLRRRLAWFGGGLLMLAIGVVLWWPLAVAGGMFLFVQVLGLLGHWLRSFGFARLWADGVTVSLLAAAGGFILLLLNGALHAAHVIAAGKGAASPVATWAVAFLLPLVTGALSQLLPVWRWPGRQTPQRQAMRTQLAATGQMRAVLFLSAGGLLTLGAVLPGAICAALGLLLFVVALLRGMRVAPATG